MLAIILILFLIIIGEYVIISNLNKEIETKKFLIKYQKETIKKYSKKIKENIWEKGDK